MKKFFYSVDSFNLKKKSVSLSSIAKLKFKKFIYISTSIETNIDEIEINKIFEMLDRYKIGWCKGILIDAKYYASTTKVLLVVSKAEEINSMLILSKEFIGESLEEDINSDINNKHALFISICEPEKQKIQEIARKGLKRFNFMLNKFVEFK